MYEGKRNSEIQYVPNNVDVFIETLKVRLSTLFNKTFLRVENVRWY